MTAHCHPAFTPASPDIAHLHAQLPHLDKADVQPEPEPNPPNLSR